MAKAEASMMMMMERWSVDETDGDIKSRVKVG